MEEIFKELPKSKYYYICKLCICTHGIKNNFIIQTNNNKQLTKLYEQHQKSLLHSESIKWFYKKEEEKDKEFYKHVNNTYKQIEKYSNKYLGYIYK